MRHHATSIRALAVACGLLASASVAQGANETWVSGNGSDSGDCPRTAPCRTFAFAHTPTNNHGAINVLTPGNFGPVTITKPISIVADGVEAVINTGADGAAIIVQAGGGAVISLRGLTIDMRGTANNGISFVSGGALHVQNCVIRKAENGIEFEPATGTPELYVADSVIGNAASSGVRVAPTASAGAKVVLDRIRSENGTQGIVLTGFATSGSITATVRETVSSGNAGGGIIALMGVVNVMVDRSAVVNNAGFGILSQGANARVRLGDSTVSGNVNDGLITLTGGVIDSYGTNKINGNGGNETPTSTIGMK